jgi:hypothetical protein
MNGRIGSYVHEQGYVASSAVASPEQRRHAGMAKINEYSAGPGNGRNNGTKTVVTFETLTADL